MAAPVAFAPRRQQQAPEDVVGTGSKSSTIWLLGLLTASTAITVVVCVPPPGLHKNAYYLAISCLFFAGVERVMSAVYTDTTTRHRHLHLHATSRKAMRVLLAQRGSVVSAAFSTTTALGVLGLAAASTATAVVVCVPPPALYENAYFLALSCFFFAGVRGVMSAVYTDTTTRHRHLHLHATSRKAMRVLLAQLGSVVSAAFSTTTALGVLGLAAASTATTVAVCLPPPALYKNAYFLAISCFFFAGVAVIMSSVCMSTTHLRDRDTTSWEKVMHVNLAQLVSVVGAAFSTKTALGVLGLAAASTAMNLQSLCQPHQPPRALDESECYYHLVIAGVFFAGVAGVMAAVREGGQVAKHHCTSSINKQYVLSTCVVLSTKLEDI